MMTCREKWTNLEIVLQVVKMLEMRTVSKILMVLRKTVAEQEFGLHNDVQQKNRYSATASQNETLVV